MGECFCTFETLTCVRSTNVSSNMSPGDGSPLSRVFQSLAAPASKTLSETAEPSPYYV